MTPALISAGLIVAVVSATMGLPLALQGNDWLWMLVLCLLIIPVGFVLITLGPMRISAAEVSMLMLLETVVGPFGIWLWLNEVPSKKVLEGGSVVVGTLLVYGFIQWQRNRPKTPPQKL